MPVSSLLPLRRTRSSSPTVNRPSNGITSKRSPGSSSRPTIRRTASKGFFGVGGGGLGGGSNHNHHHGRKPPGRGGGGGLRRMDSFGLRRKSSTAVKDLNYLNVLATEGLISTQNILDHLEEVKASDQIIKLELEDIVLRKEDEHEITDALHDLALETYERQWISIQFCDCIYAFGVGKDMDSATKQLCEYDHKRLELYENMVQPHNRKSSNTFRLSTLNLQALKDFGTSIRSSIKIASSGRNSILAAAGGRAGGGSDATGSSSGGGSINSNSRGSSGMLDLLAELPVQPPKTKKQREGHRLPLEFKVKLEIHSGTTLTEILAMMKLFVSSSHLDNIDFGGALFGYQNKNIPIKLVECFEKSQSQSQNGNQQQKGGEADGAGGEFILKEMISFNVQYASPDEDEDEIDTLDVVTQCVQKLTQLKASLEHPEIMMVPKPPEKGKLVRGRSKDGGEVKRKKSIDRSVSRDGSIRRINSKDSRDGSIRRINSKDSQDGKMRRKKSTRSLSNSSHHSNKEGSRRRRTKNDPSAIPGGGGSGPSGGQIPKRKLSRSHSAPTMKKKEGSNKSPLPSGSSSPKNMDHLLDMEDVDSWGKGGEQKKNPENDNNNNNKNAAATPPRIKKMSDGSTHRAKVTRTKSAPTSSKKEMKQHDAPPKFTTKPKSGAGAAPQSKSNHNKKLSAAADEVSESVAKKWQGMDDSSNNAGTVSTTNKGDNDDKDTEKRGNASSSGTSKLPPPSKKMPPQRTRSVPNLQKGKEQKLKSPNPTTARVSFGSDEFLTMEDSDNVGDSMYNNDESSGEEDWDDDGDDDNDEGCRRRKKSDASLSSTAHSASQRHKKKKHRRRSRSLPNLNNKREEPPDFRWDIMQQDLTLEAPPKVVGAAAS